MRHLLRAFLLRADPCQRIVIRFDASCNSMPRNGAWNVKKSDNGAGWHSTCRFLSKPVVDGSFWGRIELRRNTKLLLSCLLHNSQNASSQQCEDSVRHSAKSFYVLFVLALAWPCDSNLIAQLPASVSQVIDSPPVLLTFQPLTSTQRKVLALPASHSNTVGDFASPQLILWLTSMIRENLPPAYEDNKKWGLQKEVWDGVDIWREGRHLETKRRKKLVNAGTWTKYRVDFVEPDKNLHIEFQQLQSLPDGRIAFSVSVECLLDVFGRMSQWVRDVQMISLSVNADATCKMTMSGTVQFQLNPLKLPPDVIIKPHVDRAVVELSYFRVRRISQIGGDFAKALGEGAQGVIDKKIEETNEKLVQKINKQIDKQQSKMVFSLQNWLQSKLPAPK